MDGNKGFYQIQLSKNSKLLTTFSAGKWGHYWYRGFPYGLTSAPEVFHRCFTNIFEGLQGVEVYINDIIVWGSNEDEHQKRLEKVLERAKNAGVRFKRNNCKFGVSEVRYVGHIFSTDGLKPVILSVDSSSLGLGAVLLQDNLPVAYASKALTDCQKS